MKGAADDLLAGGFDRRQDRLSEDATREVGARGAELHHRQRANQIGIEAQLDARDVEVLEASRGLDAVIRVDRHLLLAEQVVLDAD